MVDDEKTELVELTAGIVSAYVGKNNVHGGGSAEPDPGRA